MEKSFIDMTIKTYLAEQFFCKVAELEKEQNFFTINSRSELPYIKIMTYNKCVVICTSEALHLKVKEALTDKNRDEIFEFPFIYGQTIHFIPDVKKVQRLPLPKDYSYELLKGSDIQKLKYIKGFDNSLSFDDNAHTRADIIFLAKKDNEIIGVAGASAETNSLWEVGVDVKPEYRRGGIGAALVANLTVDIMELGVVPFYSASVTNIGSQIVASRSGYMPGWVDTYGNTLDGSSVYNDLIKNLVL
ncbi:GNAT family N-acetyltransferase [Clostridium sp. YIM B02505]|uniref:GNAT family N-acetyltransferase n=1 Tax=Clostridium yunnanense TaxID=2800325 RepID=A0ABS1ERQ6_9CLOT|nr:GNAT family N-acetyltransferase [Clostridium yunnanense]MBK1812020.1 GNAT family N-acetyltransferase [Clostridium yunnanense]